MDNFITFQNGNFITVLIGKTYRFIGALQVKVQLIVSATIRIFNKYQWECRMIHRRAIVLKLIEVGSSSFDTSVSLEQDIHLRIGNGISGIPVKYCSFQRSVFQIGNAEGQTDGMQFPIFLECKVIDGDFSFETIIFL